LEVRNIPAIHNVITMERINPVKASTSSEVKIAMSKSAAEFKAAY
jgi:hypothetical protein